MPLPSRPAASQALPPRFRLKPCLRCASTSPSVPPDAYHPATQPASYSPQMCPPGRLPHSTHPPAPVPCLPPPPIPPAAVSTCPLPCIVPSWPGSSALLLCPSRTRIPTSLTRCSHGRALPTRPHRSSITLTRLAWIQGNPRTCKLLRLLPRWASSLSPRYTPAYATHSAGYLARSPETAVHPRGFFYFIFSSHVQEVATHSPIVGPAGHNFFPLNPDNTNCGHGWWVVLAGRQPGIMADL